MKGLLQKLQDSFLRPRLAIMMAKQANHFIEEAKQDDSVSAL